MREMGLGVKGRRGDERGGEERRGEEMSRENRGERSEKAFTYVQKPSHHEALSKMV